MCVFLQLDEIRVEMTIVEGQVREGRERVGKLDGELRETQREAAALRGHLVATEQVYISYPSTIPHSLSLFNVLILLFS